MGVDGGAGSASVAGEPKCRADDEAGGTVTDEGTTGFRECEIPADDETDAAPGRVEGRVWRRGVRGEVWTFWMPEVFLLVAAEDGAVRTDEVGDVGDARAGV